MKETPIDPVLVETEINRMNIADFGKATIREVVAVAARLEQISKEEFIHMEMGVPGLPPAQVGVDAQIEALRQGVASIYPDIAGIPSLKEETSRFIKAFTDLDVSPRNCIPAVGSMQGTFAAFMLAGQCVPGRDTILFIDPGFPVQRQQVNVLGYKCESFDVYDYRGDKLEQKLESFLKKGNIAGVVYSNPNNPAWICLKEEELEVIGRLARKYDTIVFEDLAYFGMDFRKELGEPFQAPYQPTVGRYTDSYILFVSGSKAFSYAGERIGMVVISDSLYDRKYATLAKRYGGGTFGSVFVQRILYAISSGVSHSVQFAMAEMLKKAADGQFRFLEEVKEYGRRAKRLKEIFRKHGFYIVYDADMEEPVADGFYFTVGYPGMSSGELMKELIYYGVSAISLATTGSRQQGIRACTSFIKDHQYDLLDRRLKSFAQNNPANKEK